ncbi:MAG: NERD domain-containing protein [Bacteroidales bacterium]|nr:NERD domain-containing protein [Bacteroidales bacterium]
MGIFLLLVILVIVFIIFVAGDNKRTSNKKSGKSKRQYNKTTTYGNKSTSFDNYNYIYGDAIGSKGRQGEDTIKEKLSALPQDYVVYNDVYIKVNERSVQIDHIIVSAYGIFVIETKNYTGNIYGTDDAEYWSKYIHGNEYKFRNPLKQNYYHLKSLQEILAFPRNLFVPIVVFTDNADIKCETREFVIYENQLKSTIYGFKTPIMTTEAVNYAINRLNASLILDKDREKRHANSINQYIREKNELINQGICPRCKSKLVERNGKYGKFLGCSNYPLCTFTKEL